MSRKSDAKPTHYEVLELSRENISRLSKDNIKSAYRRALLVHHPDKSSVAKHSAALESSAPSAQTPRYSVDDIVSAHEVLSDPVQRADYDRTLVVLGKPAWKNGNRDNAIHVGVEAFDLEDLMYDDRGGVWFKSCRCGDNRGYCVTESDLEKESQHGEIYVGCPGCSLFIKVQFAVEIP